MSTELVNQSLSKEQVELIKTTICKGSTDDELKLFITQCNRTGLDPFNRQIYAIKRWDGAQGREVMGVQVSIDGLRLVAQRSGQYEGQTKTEWCGDDGIWVDVWLKAVPPVAARVGIWRTGFREACYGVAKFQSYAQYFKNKNTGAMQLSTFWAKMPELMIGKVAEALALRKAFPQELSGLYTTEEMAQAETKEVAQEVTPNITIPVAQTKTEVQPEVVDAEVAETLKQFEQLGPTQLEPQTKTCPKCSANHTGKYAKCFNCWKAEQGGATKTKSVINPNVPPF